MQMKKILWLVPATIAALSLLLLSACGDDDDDTSNNGDTAGSGGSGTSGGGGADGGTSTAGSGGSGGTAAESGTSGGSGGTSGESGSGWNLDGGFNPFAAECSEPAPTEPVVCGGDTCEDPGSSSMFGGAGCVYACCFSQGGTEVCGARDTTVDNEVACQPPPEADTRCPDYAGGGFGADAGGTGTSLPGCCTPDNKCGVISSMRPLCITTSQLIELPATPQACDAG